MEKITRIRYCSCSKPFIDKILELGFIERGSDPDYLFTKQVRRFYKGNLIIEDSYHTLSLFKMEKVVGLKSDTVTAKKLKFQGSSVDEDLLIHFATKGESIENLMYR
jgi:hypothetical protein